MPPPTSAISTPSRRSSTCGWRARAAPSSPRPASISCPAAPCSISPAGPSRIFSPMSELAEKERRVKRGWAIPGGAHDRVVKILKLGLPALIGVVLAFLFFAPLEDKQEVSFLLDKTKVQTAPERLRVASAQYRGQDNQGRPFVLSARSAVQQTSANPIVEISDMNAQILLKNGPARIDAGRAHYNMDTD